jgi:hypothetical protein
MIAIGPSRKTGSDRAASAATRHSNATRSELHSANERPSSDHGGRIRPAVASGVTQYFSLRRRKFVGSVFRRTEINHPLDQRLAVATCPLWRRTTLRRAVHLAAGMSENSTRIMRADTTCAPAHFAIAPWRGREFSRGDRGDLIHRGTDGRHDAIGEHAVRTGDLRGSTTRRACAVRRGDDRAAPLRSCIARADATAPRQSIIRSSIY